MTVYVTRNDQNEVAKLDPVSRGITETLGVASPTSVAVTPDGSTAVVTSRSRHTITLIAIGEVAELVPTADLPTPTLGAAYNISVARSLGSPPASFAVTAGALPAGLSLDATSGVLSGTPTSAGPYSFTITATNDVGTTSVSYSGEIPAVLAATGLDPAGALAAALAMTALGGVALLGVRRAGRTRQGD